MPTGRGGTGAALAAPAMGCGRRGLRGALGLWCGVQAAVRNGSRPEGQAGLQGGLRPRGEACTDTHTPSMPLTHSCSHTRARSGSCAHLCTLTHTDTHIYAPHARTQPPHTPGKGPSDTLMPAQAAAACAGEQRRGGALRRAVGASSPARRHAPRWAPRPQLGGLRPGHRARPAVLSLGRGLLPLLVSSELRQRRGSHVHSRAWGWHVGCSQCPRGSWSPPCVALSPRAWRMAPQLLAPGALPPPWPPLPTPVRVDPGPPPRP